MADFLRNFFMAIICYLKNFWPEGWNRCLLDYVDFYNNNPEANFNLPLKAFIKLFIELGWNNSIKFFLLSYCNKMKNYLISVLFFAFAFQIICFSLLFYLLLRKFNLFCIFIWKVNWNKTTREDWQTNETRFLF